MVAVRISKATINAFLIYTQQGLVRTKQPFVRASRKVMTAALSFVYLSAQINPFSMNKIFTLLLLVLIPQIGKSQYYADRTSSILLNGVPAVADSVAGKMYFSIPPSSGASLVSVLNFTPPKILTRPLK